MVVGGGGVVAVGGGSVVVVGGVAFGQDVGGDVADHGDDASGFDGDVEGEVAVGVGAGDGACARVTLHWHVEVDGQLGRRDARRHAGDANDDQEK